MIDEAFENDCSGIIKRRSTQVIRFVPILNIAISSNCYKSSDSSWWEKRYFPNLEKLDLRKSLQTFNLRLSSVGKTLFFRESIGNGSIGLDATKQIVKMMKLVLFGAIDEKVDFENSIRFKKKFHENFGNSSLKWDCHKSAKRSHFVWWQKVEFVILLESIDFVPVNEKKRFGFHNLFR